MGLYRVVWIKLKPEPVSASEIKEDETRGGGRNQGREVELTDFLLSSFSFHHR